MGQRHSSRFFCLRPPQLLISHPLPLWLLPLLRLQLRLLLKRVFLALLLAKYLVQLLA